MTTQSAARSETSDGDAPIRVVLADDSFLLRQALLRVLEAAAGIEVVASCADGDTLMAAVAEERPDVVVTDIRMPPGPGDEGLQIAARLRDSHPGIGVVVLSQYDEPRYGLKLLERGPDRRAYLLKDRVRYRGQLVSAIETVARGGSMIDAKVIDGLVSARVAADNSPLTELTLRELEILSFVARGHSNQAIGDEVVITKRAIEKHISAIFLKLGLRDEVDVSRRVKAALIYLAENPDD